MVLKRVVQSTLEKNTRKLRSNWEGPYTVVAREGKGSHTASQDGKTLDKQWNSFHLKRYYV